MIRPGRKRSTARASDRITSTSAASLPVAAASARARGDGAIPASATLRPSALETILWVTTRTSPGARLEPRRVDGIAQDAREVVARPDRRDAGQRCEREGRGRGRHQTYPKRTRGCSGERRGAARRRG